MSTLEKVKHYQRPVRKVIWVLLIIFIVLLCLLGKCSESSTLELIIYAMFTDMGIYSMARTYEKVNTNKDAGETK